MIKEVSDPIYSQKVFIAFDCTHKQLLDHAEKNKQYEIRDYSILELDPNNYGSTFWCGGCLYVLIESEDDWNATLVHECAHATLSILDYAGFAPDHQSKHEPFCYLLDYYYAQSLKHINAYLAKTVQKGKAKK